MLREEPAGFWVSKRSSGLASPISLSNGVCRGAATAVAVPIAAAPGDGLSEAHGCSAELLNKARSLRRKSFRKTRDQRTPWGGGKRRGVENLTNDTPPKGVLDPPRTVRFPPPLRCQCSVFPVQKSTTEQTRSSFGGVKNFSGERVLWYVFLPPYALHPPISRPNEKVGTVGESNLVQGATRFRGNRRERL